jgi:D-3-phosphoglycerate dehydrogenase / 2-oxoglutarate reductase
MKITILDDYQDAVRNLRCFGKLDGHDVTIWNDHTNDVALLADRLADTEVLVPIRERAPIRAPLIECLGKLGRLKMISNIGGYPHLDIDACTRWGIIVSSNMMPGRPSYATAELNWGLMIAAMRHVPQEMAALRSGRWQATSVGTGLRGKTLGIYGYGRIGAVVAGYGKAFGMKVLVWGREKSISGAGEDGFQVAESKEALFEQSDVVSLHLQLNDATRGIVTLADLSRMKPTALIVNTSRAGLIAPGALASALRAGRPGMAAIDVFDDEPVIGAKDPLLEMENVVCTPHLGYVEQAGMEGMFGVIFDQIVAYAAGRPVDVVNPEALKNRKG